MNATISTAYLAPTSARLPYSIPASRGASIICSAEVGSAAGGVTVPITKVKLTTRTDCSLGISIWPDFSYNAAGGGGVGEATAESPGVYRVAFDPASVNIPPIDIASAKIGGIVPMPPGLRISIEARSLTGVVDQNTGTADLEFDAEFLFTVGSLYAAPPLSVVTRLTTGTSEGVMRRGEGELMSPGGECKLVGVASVPKIPTDANPVMDRLVSAFLQLPTDALAVLSGVIEFE